MYWVVDIYPDRPDELETSSLYDVLSWDKKERLPPDSKIPLQLKHVKFWLQRRTKIPYIVTHKIINLNQSEEHKEMYYYQLLKLFKPWRTKLDRSFPGLTYHKAYMKESVSLPDMVEHHHNNIQFRVSSVTRGHPYKILKPHSWATFFAERIFNTWNSLPHDSIDFSSLRAFQRGIEENDFSSFYVYVSFY